MIPFALASALAIAYGVGLFLVVLVIPLTVTALKGQWLLLVAGWFTVGMVWWIAAPRLARPGSWWARRFYGEEKMARARRRYGPPASEGSVPASS